MNESEPSSSPTTSAATSRGRARGRSRGGLGKHLRARGRRGTGRPAEWGKRQVLEGEEEIEDAEHLEEIRDAERKYAKRELISNADRYAEDEEPAALNSQGEEQQDPEVDLSAFLARQKLSSDDSTLLSLKPDDDGEEIDHSLAQFSASTSQSNRQPKKGKVQSIAWDADLEELTREKAIADANRELKARLHSQKTRYSASSTSNLGKKPVGHLIAAPPLPTDQPSLQKKDKKEQMQDFLDDLLG